MATPTVEDEAEHVPRLLRYLRSSDYLGVEVRLEHSPRRLKLGMVLPEVRKMNTEAFWGGVAMGVFAVLLVKFLDWLFDV